MDDNQGNYITEEKRKALEIELKELQTTRRKEVLDSLEFAKSLGDLSENAEYHQAREEQGKLEERISKIEHILKESIIVSNHHSTKVEVGSTVIVRKTGEKETKRYQIVGSEEVNMSQSKISNRSPIGTALLGHKKGDKTSFQSPNGAIEYTIVDIE